MKTFWPALFAPLSLACSPASIAAPTDAGIVDSGAPMGDGGATIAKTCKSYGYYRCTRLQGCSPTALELTFGDIETCETQFDTSCTATLELPNTNTTIGSYQACTAAVMDPTQWSCANVILSENYPPACQTKPGPLADGSTCITNAQCRSTFCHLMIGSPCGTCEEITPGLNCPCPQGLRCISGKCVTIVEVGAQCGPSATCDDGLTCVGGTCTTGASTQGATCDFTGAGCDRFAGLSCNALSGTCQTLQVVEPGGACGLVGNQLQDCIAGDCIHGACVSKVPIGGACVAGEASQCQGFAVCMANDAGTNGVCALPGTVACP